MASKRGNPVEEAARRVTLNQGISNPVGNGTNTDKGASGAKMKVPAGKKVTLNQGVANPSQRVVPGAIAKDRRPGSQAGTKIGK